MLQLCRPRKVRDLWTFAEQEIVFPNGPDKDLRFSVHRQPYTALWFLAHAQATSTVEELDGVADCSGLNVFICVGPTQSGKTLSTLVIPALWHLFEHEETICCLVPDEDMVNDKWQEDFRPVIEKSRYARYLPRGGQGSRNGKVTDAVRFTNGVTLKFLTGGGDDKSVAGFTTRVLLATELNAFGKLSEASSEGNRWTQAIGRTRAFGDRAVIYGECTVDTESGLVWSEYMNGTASRIAMPCGYCGDYVTLEREHLVGWQGAKTVVQAKAMARWCCPACGVIWEPGERELFARGSVLLHKRQEVRGSGTVDTDTLTPGRLLPGYHIEGDRPETFTLGLRWSAADNMFTTAGQVAVEEWQRMNASVDEQSDERKLRQFVWALPIEDESESTLTVSAHAVRRRMGGHPRGIVPEGYRLAAFLDLGKRLCHYGVMAGHDRYAFVDTGVIEVPTGDRTTEEGLKLALWQWYDRVLEGWGPQAQRPGIVNVDSGKWNTVVYEFIRDVAKLQSGVMWFAAKGHGISQDQGRVYQLPDQRTTKLPYVGDHYHLRFQEAHGIYLLHQDSDWWKSKVHSGLTTEIGEPGSLVLWQDEPNAQDIWTLSKHLTAERGVEEFDVKRGMVTRWERMNRNNHLLDCAYGCLVGLDYLAVVEALTKARPAPQQRQESTPSRGGGVFNWDRT